MRDAMQMPAWIRSAIGGAVLLTLGTIVLIDDLGFQLHDRWFALILLVPAGFVIADAWRLVGRTGRIGVDAVARGLVGLVYAAIGILLFLGLETSVVLPSLVIVLGLGAIVRAVLNR
jgi:hypothetical protein